MARAPLSAEFFASLRGKSYAPFVVLVTSQRIGAYAAAIGDTSRLRTDPDLARAAGYRDVVAPPTFAFTLALLAGQADLILAEVGAVVNDTLHGEQGFRYHAPACAGDVLTGRQTITNVQTKKHGSLLFLESRYVFTNQLGEHVLDMSQTSIVLVTDISA
jgi:acyl dehydratase